MTPIVWPRRFATANGSVIFDWSLMRIRGAMKSFHAVRKANRPTVIRPGLTAGSSTRRRAEKLVQPSTRAASSSSRGTDSNEMRIMNIENGSWNIVSTSATPTSEFCSPTAFRIT